MISEILSNLGYWQAVRQDRKKRDVEKEIKKGFWIIRAAGENPETIYHFDWNRDLVLVLGSEDKGLSPSVRGRCHRLVSIRSDGPVNSLNISVVGDVIISEIVRQRKMGNKR